MIDLSPCIGIYQEAVFFNDYSIEKAIDQYFLTHEDQRFLYNESVQKASLEYKILFLTSMETQQNRYRFQVSLPYVSDQSKLEIIERLQTVFSPEETVQESCSIGFTDPDGRPFYANGRCDVLVSDAVYELKFVLELQHEHFLQCACYMVALGLKVGILWNVRDNKMYQVTVPDREKFLDAVVTAITKGVQRKYLSPKLPSMAAPTVSVKSDDVSEISHTGRLSASKSPGIPEGVEPLKTVTARQLVFDFGSLNEGWKIVAENES